MIQISSITLENVENENDAPFPSGKGKMFEVVQTKAKIHSDAKRSLVERVQQMDILAKFMFSGTVTLTVVLISVLIIYQGNIFEAVTDFGETLSGDKFTPTAVPKLADGPKIPTSLSHQEWLALNGQSCGKAVVEPNLKGGRIVGGDQARKNSWPWQIALVKYKKSVWGYIAIKHHCGGTLVAPKVVVTATHCFLIHKGSITTGLQTNPTSFRVIVGGHAKNDLTRGAKFIEIETIHLHPKNNLMSYASQGATPVNDLAVLILKTAVIPRGRRHPIVAMACLPRVNHAPNNLHLKQCYSTGWGKTRGTGFPKVLKQVRQYAITQAQCRRHYGSAQYDVHQCIRGDRMLQGTCQGDSGGPFVCMESNGRWTLYGATSFGSADCSKPNVVVQLANYVEWICCFMANYGPCRTVKCNILY